MAQSKRTTTKKKTTKKKVAKKAGAPGVRIYELSRELDEPKSSILEAAASLRIPATSQFSTVTEEQAQRIRDAFSSAPAAPKKETKKQASKKASKRSAIKATATTTTRGTGGKKKAATRVVVTQDVGRSKAGNPRLKTLCMQFLEGCGC